jgi:hypothetical protein
MEPLFKTVQVYQVGNEHQNGGVEDMRKSSLTESSFI